MPLRVNIGLSKKVGLPNYGSVGATCEVNVELDGGLLYNDLDGFHRHVRNAFVACRQAVHDELALHAPRAATNGNGQPVKTPGANAGASAGAPIDEPSQNGRFQLTQANHRISEKQLSYAAQLAGTIRKLGVRRLDALTHQLFGKPLAELSSVDGSTLIDVLKDIQAGNLELDAALAGENP